MFNSDCSIKYQYRDLFSSGEYIVTINDNTRINDNIPIDFYNLLKSYSNSQKINSEFNLVCFGGGNFTKDEKKLFRQLKIEESKILHFEGNDMTLNYFYKHARIFVYPSLYEGFGIPLLEAMKMKCPVACSDTSSFPEVAGDAAIYFNPDSIDSIISNLEKSLFNNQQLNKLTINGIENIQRFSLL